MYQPDALKTDAPLTWSPGTGSSAWALFMASMNGDTKTINDLLDKDPDLVRASYEYRPALGFAVRENQLAAARLLLDRGANPVQSGTGDTLLQIARDRGFTEMANLLEQYLKGIYSDSPVGSAISQAIRNKDLKLVRQLLDKEPALVHEPDQSTNRPIHWAVMTRQPAIIDELLARGADINVKHGDGALPIQLCNGDYSFRGWRDVPADHPVKPGDVLRHLRAKGAYVDICTASYIGDLERVKELLNEDPALAKRPSDYVTYYALSGMPLRNAADGGHIEIVKLLLEYGADPNYPEEGIAPRGMALHAAVCNNNIEIVQLLLDHGAYPNVEVESSADTLSAAIARSNKPMIELLCSYGAARRVHLLAYYGDIQEGAAVFAANPELANDVNALENAAVEGHAAFVRLMLRYQPGLAKKIAVGVRSKGPDGGIASKELTEYLFSQGMNANLLNWLHISPLHTFARRGELENANLFIEHGADINAVDEEMHSTPLGYAAKYGQVEMVKLLLEKGADKTLPVEYPWAQPLAWAKRKGFLEIEKLLGG